MISIASDCPRRESNSHSRFRKSLLSTTTGNLYRMFGRVLFPHEETYECWFACYGEGARKPAERYSEASNRSSLGCVLQGQHRQAGGVGARPRGADRIGDELRRWKSWRDHRLLHGDGIWEEGDQPTGADCGIGTVSKAASDACDCEVGPACAQCALHFWPDGINRRFRCHRSADERPLHVAFTGGVRGRGGTTDFRAHQGSSRRRQTTWGSDRRDRAHSREEIQRGRLATCPRAPLSLYPTRQRRHSRTCATCRSAQQSRCSFSKRHR
jgi:hypothetical protein